MEGVIAEASDVEPGRVRVLEGWQRILATTFAVALAAYALYWVVGIVSPQIYRPTFLLIALILTFMLYAPALAAPTRPFVQPGSGSPAQPGSRRGIRAIDWLLIAVALLALGWPIVDATRFVFRAATPTTLDLVLGAALILVILEATRRTVGWILPVTTILFLVYAYIGPWLDRIGLDLIAHRGYAPARIIGTLYMTLDGIFGVPLDVAATYIVLFTIYGAMLDHSGAGRFFVDWAMAAIGRSRHGAGPGRTVTLAGYLLGAVSGSGVANTVMLGSVTWPMMRRAGYPPDIAGAILAAAGIGAILAPPVMGAAAFLIAEFLNISYVAVMGMALIPAALYYLSIVVTVEAESRRLALRAVVMPSRSLAAATKEGWFYFVSVIAIAVFMLRGVTAFRAVFWATVIAFAASFLNPTSALRPRRLVGALAAGGTGVISVVATTAAAGIIVGVVTLTGLGLKAATVIVTLAGGNVPLTVFYAALAVWVLGLAVPVTASYIIAAVMIAPALTQVGIPPTAAHMFIFYYAVLSEVSPPTALSPFAAAALTGGDPFRTTLLSWKYTLPAFLVPCAFTLHPAGRAILLDGSLVDIARVSLLAAAGVVAIALGAAGYIRRAATPFERGLLIAGGLLLLYPVAVSTAAGIVLLAAAFVLHRGVSSRSV